MAMTTGNPIKVNPARTGNFLAVLTRWGVNDTFYSTVP
jgi:hypothetical protein